MTQISKYYLSKEIYDYIFDIFLHTLARLKTKDSVDQFLEEFLTPTEKIMLSKRLAIGLLIAKKFSYKDISRILKVSTTTVGRMSLSYKYGTAYKNMVDKILLNEQINDFLLDIGETIAAVGDIGGAKAAGWRALRRELINKKKLAKPF